MTDGHVQAKLEKKASLAAQQRNGLKRVLEVKKRLRAKLKKLQESRASSDSPADLHEDLARLGLEHEAITPDGGLVRPERELDDVAGENADEPGDGLEFTAE